jgi:uncharacterized protein (DUF305 family)
VRTAVAWVTLPGMTTRYVRLCTAVLALALTGCGASTTTELAPASAEQAAPALAADLQPLHAEAVELADLVLAADPSPATAAVVRRVRTEAAGLLADADRALAGATPGSLGALTEAELEAVRQAAGEEAVRLGLAGLLRNHLDAVARAKAEVVRGTQGTARELADRVLAVQGARLADLPTA